jgi:hypothetical protein
VPSINFDVSSVTVDEEATAVSVTLTLSNPSTSIITVDVTSSDGSAAAGSDYTAVSETITFMPLETTATVTVPILDDNVGESAETFTLILSSPVNALLGVTNELTIEIEDGDSFTIFLPMIANNSTRAPDLIVEELNVTGSEIEVVIGNVGNTAVTDEFWVDVYIDPDTPPTAVNQTIESLDSDGAVWGVTASALPLLPGESLVLMLDDAYFDAGMSRLSLPAGRGTAVYAQVDSAHTKTTYGAVLENHERLQDSYNNIIQETSQ